MEPHEFREWRKAMGFTQSQAATELGLSSRTVTTYETVGPVPRVIELACIGLKALKEASSTQPEPDFEAMVKSQHPKIGDKTFILPQVTRKSSRYSRFLKTELTEEAKEFMEDSISTGKFMLRTVVTESDQRYDVPIVTFEDEHEMLYFKLAWY